MIKNNHYHNLDHHSKVVFYTDLLCKRNDIKDFDYELLILTAIIHDIEFNPEIKTALQNELNSFEYLRYKNIFHNFSDQEIARIFLMLMATSISNRNDLRNKNTNNFFIGKILNYNIFDCCTVISDADLIPSFGIGIDEFKKSTALLEEENHKIFDTASQVKFIENVVGDFISKNTLDFTENKNKILDSLKTI